MTDTAGAAAAAHDATVDTTTEVETEDPRAAAVEVLERARYKLDKEQEALATAEQAVADAEAALAALEEGN